MSENELQKLKQFKSQEQITLKKIFPNYQIDLRLDYNRWDNICHDKKYLVEIKNRDFTYQEFIKTPYYGRPMIEVDKYNACITKASKMGYKFIYIFYFSCGTALFINFSDQSLAPILFQEKYIKCPKNTFTEEKTMINKLVYILPAYLLNKNNTLSKIIK